MSDWLIWGVALIIPVVVIITYILAQRYRVKMTVEKGLHEEKKAPVTIIEAGSNFTTRMGDFKKNMNRLNEAMNKRNEMISKLRGSSRESTDNDSQEKNNENNNSNAEGG